MFLYREKYWRLKMLNLCHFNNVLGQILSVFHTTEISKQCEHLLNLVCVYFRIFVLVLFMSLSV